MKRLFYGLIFLVLLTQSVAAQKKSDREIDGLIGSVSTIRRCIAEMQNKDGSWVEEEKKYPGHIFYERDGKNPKKTAYSYHLGCYNDVKVTNTYDSLGNRIMTLSLTDSDTKIYKGKWVYVYDNNDREIEHLFYNQANEMISKMVMTYNELGAEKGIADYDGKGVLERTVSFIYKEFDAKGNWIKRVVSVWNPKLGTESQWAEYQTINYYP